jgi:hypothetical protein
MERGDLVVVLIGDDDRLRGVAVALDPDEVGACAPRLETARYSCPSSPTAAITRASPPSWQRLYAMLPAQPPNSRRRVGTRNETLRMCSCSGRICCEK